MSTMRTRTRRRDRIAALLTGGSALLATTAPVVATGPKIPPFVGD